jgi:hypothetical protein
MASSPVILRKVAVLGIYDGYPDGITEYVLKKSLQPHHQACLEGNGMHSGSRPNMRCLGSLVDTPIPSRSTT